MTCRYIFVDRVDRPIMHSGLFGSVVLHPDTAFGFLVYDRQTKQLILPVDGVIMMVVENKTTFMAAFPACLSGSNGERLNLFPNCQVTTADTIPSGSMVEVVPGGTAVLNGLRMSNGQTIAPFTTNLNGSVDYGETMYDCLEISYRPPMDTGPSQTIPPNKTPIGMFTRGTELLSYSYEKNTYPFGPINLVSRTRTATLLAADRVWLDPKRPHHWLGGYLKDQYPQRVRTRELDPIEY